MGYSWFPTAYRRADPEAAQPLVSEKSSIDTFTLLENQDQPPWQRLPPKSRWPWILHILLLSLSTTLFLTSYHLHNTQPLSTTQVLPHISSYSPARSAVVYEDVHFNATQGAASGYIGATKAVDMQWGRVNFGDQMMSADEMRRVRKPLDSLMVTDPKTGEQGYRIGLEVFHQLHCLNMVRKATYPDYEDEYEGGDFGVPREMLRSHLDHCIEMLRMNLMCHADIGVITFHEFPEIGLWPDFSSWHKCRNYERIRDWAVEHTVATDPV